MAQQRSIEIRAGIFVLVCLVVGGWLVLRFGKINPHGQKTYEIFVTFDNVGGLIPDANVMYAGVGIGKVRSIRLVEDGRIRARVALDIYQGVMIRDDARFVINQSGLLGDRYVDVLPQSSTAPPIKPGATVSGAPSVDLTEAIRGVVDVLHQTAGIIERVDKTVQRVDSTVLSRPTLDHLSSALANADAVSSNAVQLSLDLRSLVDQNREHINHAVQKFSDTSDSIDSAAKHAEDLVQQTGGFLKQADRFVGHADQLLATNQADIRLASKNFAEAAQRLNVILDRVEQGQGTVGKLLVDPSLHDELLRLIENWRHYGLFYKEGRPAQSEDRSSRAATPTSARPVAKPGSELKFGTDLTPTR